MTKHSTTICSVVKWRLETNFEEGIKDSIYCHSPTTTTTPTTKQP